MHTFSTQRFLAASPTAVFAAIAQPERLARWWGPQGFSNEFEVFEFEPGGRWVFTMVGPDGTRYPNESVFRQIELDCRLVIAHVVPPLFELRLDLQPVEGGRDWTGPRCSRTKRWLGPWRTSWSRPTNKTWIA